MVDNGDALLRVQVAESDPRDTCDTTASAVNGLIETIGGATPSVDCALFTFLKAESRESCMAAVDQLNYALDGCVALSPC